MQLIEQYIFRRVLTMTVSTLVVVTVIVLATQLLNRVAMLTRTQEAMTTFLKLAGLLTPSMAMLVIPFALLVGIMRTMSAMNADSELAVLEASGRSPAATARPIVALSIAFTLLSLANAHLLEPWSNRTLRLVIAEATADLVRTAAQAGTFQMFGRGSYIQIAEQLPGGDFGKVVIVDTRDPKTELLYYAKRGALIERDEGALFLLVDGQVHRKNKLDGNVSIIDFASTALDFSQFLGRVQSSVNRPQEMATSYLFAPDPSDKVALKAPHELRREIHRRFSEWLYPLLFGLIAVYFAGSARTTRQQQPAHLMAGGLIALVLRALGFISVSNAGSSFFFAAITYAVPIGGIIVFAALILANTRMPRAVTELAASAAAPFAALYERVAGRFFPRQGAQGGHT